MLIIWCLHYRCMVQGPFINTQFLEKQVMDYFKSDCIIYWNAIFSRWLVHWSVRSAVEWCVWTGVKTKWKDVNQDNTQTTKQKIRSKTHHTTFRIKKSDKRKKLVQRRKHRKSAKQKLFREQAKKRKKKTQKAFLSWSVEFSYVLFFFVGLQLLPVLFCRGSPESILLNFTSSPCALLVVSSPTYFVISFSYI